mgnify:CR=1 FL=1
MRSKPEQTVERLIAKIKTPLALRDKQKLTIETLQGKIRELDTEASETKKSIEQMEA